MSDELSREQLIDQLDRVADEHIKIHRPLMIASIIAHDAAQRAKVEKLENHNEVYRSTIDTQATQLNDYVLQLATLTAERDLLREAGGEVMKYLNQLDKDGAIRPQRHLDMWPWNILQAALRGEGG